MDSANASRSRARRVVRFLAAGVAITAVSLAGLVIAGVFLVKQAASRVVVDPAAVSAFLHESIITTIREGTPEEKIALLTSFGTMTTADAAPYLPLIEEAAMDEDAAVSRAAQKVLQHLSPAAPPASRP